MITIYTDGGCDPNPGPGAWAFSVFEEGESYYDQSGFDQQTTNNRMELMAILKAMTFIYDERIDIPVQICSDSSYGINSITKWMDRWASRGWRDVKNPDLMRSLYRLRNALPNISFTHVRGHSGIPGNNYVDRLCTLKMRQEHKIQKKEKAAAKQKAKEGKEPLRRCTR